MKKLLSACLLALLAVRPAAAGDFSALGSLTQTEFRTLAEDLGAAFSYKPIAPSAPQGITGFDLGVAVTGTDVSRSAGALSRAGGSDSSFNYLLMPRLHLHKGLPAGLDIGAFIASAPALNVNVSGAELRYAVLAGGLTTPAVAVRGAVTRMSGASQLGLATRSLDVSISKGFVMLTPYAGIGQVWVDATPAAGSLTQESFTLGKLYAGLNVNMGLLNLGLEADRTGEASSWSVKLGLRW